MTEYADVLSALPRILQIFDELQWDVDAVRYVLLGSPQISWAAPSLSDRQLKTLWQDVVTVVSDRSGSSILDESASPSVRRKRSDVFSRTRCTQEPDQKRDCLQRPAQSNLATKKA